jgi:EpsG family
LYKNNKNSIILFLIWPFFALSFAIRNYKSEWAKNIIWLFVIFHGYTLTIHSETAEGSIDANRYKLQLAEMHGQELSFDNFTASLYSEDTQYLDVFQPAVIFLVSRVTGNHHILFAIFGLIFGFFYSRNIWYLIDKAGRGMKSVNIPIILTFAFIVGFWEINGFRFWTATLVFFYGVLPYLFEGKKKYLIFSFLSIFIHFSYLFPIVILLIYLVAGRRANIYFALFIASMFIKELNLSTIGDYLSNNLPEIFLPRVKGYTSEDYANEIADTYLTANWYAVIYRDILKWVIVAFMTVVFFKGKKFIDNNKNFDSVFSFTLLLYAIANIFSLVPSGGRFLYLANLCAFAFILLYVQFAPDLKIIKKLITLSVPALILYCIVSVRIAFDTMGFFSIFGNPLLTFFIDVDITLIEVAKGLF